MPAQLSRHFTFLFILILAVPFLSGNAVAQEDEESEAASDSYEAEIVVTGTRRTGQAAADTASPVDLFDGSDLSSQANFDLTENFTRIAPSFNTQRFPIADGTSFVRPVVLRNLSPDHTLLLINGTRRHRSALVNLQLAPLGTVNQGAQAPDFALIPVAAISRIEVLRDGASAQYGSDAIAGVVNVILKEEVGTFSAYAQGGEYAEGDGARSMASLNGGFRLGDGFINATVEYASSDETSRGVARPDAAFVASVVGAENVPINGFGQRWGDPNVDSLKFFLNAGHPLGGRTEIFSQVSYAKNEVISDFFYRTPVLPNPADQQQVSARTTLQIDSDGDGLPDPAPQSLVNGIITSGLNPADYLVPDITSPSGFVLRNPIFTLFPGGYNPDFGADIKDFSFVGGIRGETAGGWSWDIRGRFAENEVAYVLSESINPSLGRLSPTSFRPGTLTQEETGFNADFVRSVPFDALYSPLNVALGLEIRRETYKIGAGDSASRENGPTAAVFGVGSDGFQGFPIESAGSFSSNSRAGYVDLEANVTERFTSGLALRAEDYSEFGSTFDWKVVGRFDFTDQFALRATVSTGFRAPTPGQINTLNVTTSADANGNLVPSGTFPVNHPVALALGAQPLGPEESENFTFGAIFRPMGDWFVTLDYYRINIEDRLALRNITIGPAEVAQLDAAGVPDAALLNGSLVNFFVNAFESEVTGVDLAVSNQFDVGAGQVSVDLRHNMSDQEVKRVAPNSINESRVFDLENQVPGNRTTFTTTYRTGSLSAWVRLNNYGSWKSTGGLFSPGDASDASNYGSELLVDLEVSYAWRNFQLSVGGENVFDTFPDPEQDPVLQFLGVRHSLTSPFGFNGRFLYAKLSGRF